MYQHITLYYISRPLEFPRFVSVGIYTVVRTWLSTVVLHFVEFIHGFTCMHIGFIHRSMV